MTGPRLIHYAKAVRNVVCAVAVSAGSVWLYKNHEHVALALATAALTVAVICLIANHYWWDDADREAESLGSMPVEPLKSETGDSE